MGDGIWLVAVSAGHEYMGGRRGSCIVSSADVELEMRVVHGLRGVSGVCEM